MERRLVVLNAALVGVALLSVGYVVRELRAPATPRTSRPGPPTTAETPPPAVAPETPAGGYGVVASRNLFSPTRSEAPVGPPTPAAAAAKPNLYGIILRDGAPVAYLEDPATKRVTAYRLGDSVAGGTVKQITSDHVVLNRPDGEVNVRLRDPSKPRPAPTPPAGQPGAPVTPGAPPALVPPGTPPAVTVPQPPQPGQAIAPLPGQPPVPGQPPIVPRRPIPPNLLRRLPPSASDAPAQQ